MIISPTIGVVLPKTLFTIATSTTEPGVIETEPVLLDESLSNWSAVKFEVVFVMVRPVVPVLTVAFISKVTVSPLFIEPMVHKPVAGLYVPFAVELLT